MSMSMPTKQHDDEEAPASHRRPCIVMLPSRAATKGMLLHGDVVVIGEARRDDRSPVKVAPLKVKSPHNKSSSYERRAE